MDKIHALVQACIMLHNMMRATHMELGDQQGIMPENDLLCRQAEVH